MLHFYMDLISLEEYLIEKAGPDSLWNNWGLRFLLKGLMVKTNGEILGFEVATF